MSKWFYHAIPPYVYYNRCAPGFVAYIEPYNLTFEYIMHHHFTNVSKLKSNADLFYYNSGIWYTSDKTNIKKIKEQYLSNYLSDKNILFSTTTNIYKVKFGHDISLINNIITNIFDSHYSKNKNLLRLDYPIYDGKHLLSDGIHPNEKAAKILCDV